MKILLPEYVKTALDILNRAGYEAWVVGGCVRDCIMGRKPNDYDIAVSALQEQIIPLFQKTIPTGIKHGTITAVINGNMLEITTFRIDGSYNDSRHPDDVQFVSSIEQDLSRRDFTVNAIAYNDTNGIFDPFGGISDINSRILRTVGEPDCRFGEDALRIMRLFRFSAQLEFTIESGTLHSALNCAGRLSQVSIERIRDEFLKTLCAVSPGNIISLLHTNALLFAGLPDSADNFDYIAVMCNDTAARFSQFCVNNGLLPESLCKKLRMSNRFTADCTAVCGLLNSEMPRNGVEIKNYLRNISTGQFECYLKCLDAACDTAGIRKVYNRIISDNEPYRTDMLKINGADIVSAGYNGKAVGSVLSRLLETVIENPALNTRAGLLKLIEK